MNMDTMKVAIRPMSTPQALDLGMVMARQWFIPLWQIWLGMALPIYLVFYLGGLWLDINSAFSIGAYGGLVFWWFKPLYEKPMVLWLGQALFADAPRVKTSILSGWRQILTHAPTLLISKRLSLQRQLLLPILLLEQPDNKQFKARTQILSRGQGGGLGWHTTVMLHIEMILGIATLVLIWQLMPTQFVKTETLFTLIEQGPLWAELGWALIYFLAASIVAPFFIAGGFAVYLTKRCLLEGWDIELVFKQLRHRYERDQADPLRQLTAPNQPPAASQATVAPVLSKAATKVSDNPSQPITSTAHDSPVSASQNMVSGSENTPMPKVNEEQL
ncbi:hypothetical protein PSAR109036_03305 [Psychrobacter arenosus]|uniref:hypothetical protein n=1 Tax=Psychrobacter arenosus TaxID=256326 RepID=UPI001917AFF6|nr:hypothetical protein [Psychrobacter arenosus]